MKKKTNSLAITDAEFAGFGTYKYSAIDDSPLSKYVMHPFWDWCVQFMPKTWAPNTITLLGFCHSILQVVLLTIYDPNFQESKNDTIPRWVWFVCAFAQFMAHTLDGIDGKQARRLKKGSALGELFDHGVDAWTCCLILMSVFSAIGVGYDTETPQLNPIDMFITVWALQSSFFMSQLEKFVTGTLYLPWAYDASMVGLAGFYLVCGSIGTSFLHNSWVILGIRVFVYLSIPGLTLPMFYKIYTIKTNEGDAIRNKRSWRDIWFGFQPLLLAVILTFAWFFISKETTNYRVVCFLCGALFANMTCRLIILQMSEQAPRIEHYCNIFLVFCFIGLVLEIFVKFGLEQFWDYEAFSSVSLWIWLIIAVVINLMHMIYCADVIVNLSRHLNIYPFSVADRAEAEKETDSLV